MQPTTLDGKVVVITGASSGFGRGGAIRFGEAGAAVVLAARRGELLEQLARQFESNAFAVPTDVSNREDVERPRQERRRRRPHSPAGDV